MPITYIPDFYFSFFNFLFISFCYGLGPKHCLNRRSLLYINNFLDEPRRPGAFRKYVMNLLTARVWSMVWSMVTPQVRWLQVTRGQGSVGSGLLWLLLHDKPAGGGGKSSQVTPAPARTYVPTGPKYVGIPIWHVVMRHFIIVLTSRLANVMKQCLLHRNVKVGL